MVSTWITNSIRNKLLMITGLSTAVVVGVAVIGFWQGWSSVNSFQDITNGAVANERTILIMVADFKKQVQEWKDVLLRGSDPQKLEKYWGHFEKQEETVQTLGNHLQDRLTNQDAKNLVEQFLSAHKTMGEAYRRAAWAIRPLQAWTARLQSCWNRQPMLFQTKPTARSMHQWLGHIGESLRALLSC